MILNSFIYWLNYFWLVRHEELQKHNIATYYFQKDDAVYTEASSNFGEVGFKAICNEKPYLVLEVMKLGFNVLWTDSDILNLYLIFNLNLKYNILNNIINYIIWFIIKYCVAG